MARRAAIAAVAAGPRQAAADLETAIAGFRAAGDTRAAAAAMNSLSDVFMTLGDLRFRDASAAALELAEGDGPSPVLVDVLLIGRRCAGGRGPGAGARSSTTGPWRSPRASRCPRRLRHLASVAPRAARSAMPRARRPGPLFESPSVKGAQSTRPACSSSCLDLVSFEGTPASLEALETCKEIALRSHIEGLVTDAGGLAVRNLYWVGEWRHGVGRVQGAGAESSTRWATLGGWQLCATCGAFCCWAAAMPFEADPFRRWRSRWRGQSFRSAACRRCTWSRRPPLGTESGTPPPPSFCSSSAGAPARQGRYRLRLPASARRAHRRWRRENAGPCQFSPRSRGRRCHSAGTCRPPCGRRSARSRVSLRRWPARRRRPALARLRRALRRGARPAGRGAA